MIPLANRKLDGYLVEKIVGDSPVANRVETARDERKGVKLGGQPRDPFEFAITRGWCGFGGGSGVSRREKIQGFLEGTPCESFELRSSFESLSVFFVLVREK